MSCHCCAWTCESGDPSRRRAMAGSTTGAMRQRSASGRTSSDGSGQAGVRALLSTNGTRGKACFPRAIGSACTTSGGQHGDRPTVAPEVACGGPARPIGQRSCRWHAPEPSRGPGGPVGRRRRSPGLLPTSAATVLPSNVLLVGRPFARPTGDHGWALAITDLGSAAAGPVSLRSAPAPSAHDAHQRPYGRPRRNAATPRGSRGGPGSDAKGPPGLACGW